MSIGKKLRKLLRIKGLDETELAECLGIPAQQLSDYLDDKQEPDVSTLSEMSAQLSVTPAYFTDGSIQDSICGGIKLGDIERIYDSLNNHQKLIDYISYEIYDLSEENIENKHIYSYMLALSSTRIDKICNEFREYLSREHKRILDIEYLP